MTDIPAYKDAIEEIESIVRRGFKEIVLTGICLGAWGRELKIKEDLSEDRQID